MKNFLFSLLFYSIINICFSQTNSTDYLEENTEPSPQAAQFTKYGNIEANAAYGRVNHSIPLYTYKMGKIQVPISMDYDGIGVKVNQTNTWTGVNWKLNVGGAITRTVYDRPDEDVSQRIFKNDIDNLVDTYESDPTINPGAINASQLGNYLFLDNYDTQPDIFNFSFLGISGSFYLDQGYNPILINAENDLKIEIEGAGDNKSNLNQFKTFKITDANGVEYFFGGAETETSKKEVGWHNNVSPLATTAYHLYMIKHPMDGLVLFEYDKSLNYLAHIDFSSQYAQALNSQVGVGTYDIVLSPTGHVGGNRPDRIISNISGGKYLTKIFSSSGEEVVFHSDNQGYSNNKNISNVLNSIEVINTGNNQKLMDIDFEYIFDIAEGVQQRFFLEHIKINEWLDNNSPNMGKDYKQYEFVYNNPVGLPKRFSYSQDLFGYYNGVDNSDKGMLPINDDNTVGVYGEADRSSDFGKMILGSLKKIIYPTGGYTLLEYEQPLNKKVETEHYQRTIHRNMAAFNPPNKLTTNCNLGGFEDDGTGNLIFKTIPISQTISVNVNVEFSQMPPDKDWVYVELFEIFPNQSPVSLELRNFKNTPNDWNGSPYEINKQFDFQLQAGHAYSLRFYKGFESLNTPMQGQLFFDYKVGDILTPGEGLRIKRISDFTSNATNAQNIKRYYYTGKENVRKDPLEYVPYYQDASFIETTDISVENNCKPPEIIGAALCCYVDQKQGTRLNIHPTNYNENILNSYEKVTISYGGDDFENGGIEKCFYKEGGDIVNMFKAQTAGGAGSPEKIEKTHSSATWSAVSVRNGKLQRENFISNENNTLRLESQKIYGYHVVNLESLTAVVGSFGPYCGPGYAGYRYSNFRLGSYDIFSKKLLLVSKKMQKFYPAILFNEDIEESNKLVTKTEYDYDSHVGQPTKITTTTSDSDVENIVKNRYPYGGPTQLDPCLSIPDQQHYQALYDQHRISSPYQTETYVKEGGVERLTSVKRVIYDLYNSTGGPTTLPTNGILMPSKVQTSKVGECDLEDRFEYLAYNEDGYPTLLKNTNGTQTKLVYNNRNQIETLVENFTFDNGDPVYNLGDPVLVRCEKRNAQYPGALITSYRYDSVTHQLTWEQDPRCQVTEYEYDDYHRLEYIKDMEGNILQEYDYNYKN
ncbi:hypothetical protein [Mesonia sp. K4-1]|uniref:hypothetical protein n=1 Tax=Mesonia sp. K4-1 TaxID=2602760 RepID=UPI0011CC4D76|nr:hypothetical protein [Mesonia sp. K4-1]TXK78895.1 hypothetical protein FT986_03605 [Mesonia sp. K4-1]